MIRGALRALAGCTALLLVPLLNEGVALASEVRAETEARRVAVGETFIVQVTAILDEGHDSAEEPSLPVQGPAEVAGPSIATQRRMVMQNFNIKTEHNVVASYEVTPTRPGHLVLGPGSFVIGGQRLLADALTVEVVDGPPQGSPRSRGRRGRDPFGFGFDPFGQDPLGRDPSGQDALDGLRRRGGLSAYPDAPAELNLPTLPNEVGFLMARLDQPTAVVGEPVVLSIYAYGGRGAFRELSPTEPALADFLSYPSVETSHEQPFFRAEVAGREFLVVKLRELVLVPLRTGKLQIGPMRAILRGRGYPSQGSPLGSAALSQPIELTVREPPLDDRPMGYRLGDVGRFELSAEVTPREVSEHDFVSVRLELRGRGNLPGTVEMPEVPGVVWGDPTVRGEVNVEGRELVGSRVLEFTAKMERPGSIELGAVTLPHFDPGTHRYRIASAALGAIAVQPAGPSTEAPATAAPASTDAQPDGRALLLGLSPRLGSSGWRPTRDAPPLWGLGAAVAAPGLVWLLALVPGLLAASRHRLKRRRSKKAHADVGALAALEKAGKGAQVAGEVERLLYRLIEDKTGLRARAILKEHLSARLEAAGLNAELAHDLEALLVSVESMRFLTSGETKDPSLIERAKPILARLDKLPQRREDRT